jgi:hypothetical protein
MENNFQRPEKVKTAFNNSKLTLSAPCPTAKGKYSTLGFDFANNNPAIVVRTNDPADTTPANGYGTISAKLDSLAFYVFLENLKAAIASEGEIKIKCENYNHDYVDGQRSQEIKHLTDLWVGKDKEGCPYISVLSKKEDRPVIKFTFGPSDGRWHKYFNADGTPFTKAQLAKRYADAFVALLTHVTANIMVSAYVAPVPRKPYGGQQGGGNRPAYNNNRPGGNSYSKPAADVVEEDLPF